MKENLIAILKWSRFIGRNFILVPSAVMFVLFMGVLYYYNGQIYNINVELFNFWNIVYTLSPLFVLMGILSALYELFTGAINRNTYAHYFQSSVALMDKNDVANIRHGVTIDGEKYYMPTKTNAKDAEIIRNILLKETLKEMTK